MDARSCCTTVDVLAGKNVLITGASRGIGRELALNYCRMGANVFITARDEKKLKEVCLLVLTFATAALLSCTWTLI